MKTALAIAAISVVMAVAPQFAAAAPAMTDEAQIKALEQQFSDAFNAKDLNAIMKVYVPDNSLFVFDVGTPRQHVGAADYRKDWQDLLAMFKGPIKFEVTDLSITTDGKLAFSHSIQHLTGTDTKGKTIDEVVRVTDGYKNIGGHWLIAQEHVSMPIDFATGKPDMMSKP